jgi:hypothetical protein
MKAEQRKELETNALADRMGHMVQRVKTQPRRAALYWVLGVAAIFIALFVVFRWYQTSRVDNSRRWVDLEIGARDMLGALTKDAPETNQGKAARFQQAWFFYWELGIKRLGVGDGDEAIKALNAAASAYKKLAEECADDPVWESEAMYGLAVIEETRAVQDKEHLKEAKTRYEELVTKYKDSARGKLAGEWLRNYDDDKERVKLEEFYTEMRASLRIPDPIAPKKGFDFGKGFTPKKTQ